MSTQYFSIFFQDNPSFAPFEKVTEEQFASTLLQKDNCEELALLFFDAVQDLKTNKEIAARLVKNFSDAFENCSENERSQFTDPFYKTLQAVKSVFHWSFPKASTERIGTFDEYSLKLSDFHTVKDQETKLENMFQQETDVNNHALSDAEFRRRIQEYEVTHRTEYLHSVIQAGKSPKMVIIGTPRTDKEDTVNKFFKAALDLNIQLIVALNTASDWAKAIAYYDDEILMKVDVDGWQVSCMETKELYTGTIARNIPKSEQKKLAELTQEQKEEKLLDECYKEYRPKIIERRLVCRRNNETKTITHLHYLNWPDRREAPDLDGLMVLLKRHTDILSKQTEPSMLIHCQGGVGRTNFYAILSWLVREIEQDKGEKGSRVYNIPEMMFELKKQAPRLGGVISGARFAQIYEMADRYYREEFR